MTNHLTKTHKQLLPSQVIRDFVFVFFFLLFCYCCCCYCCWNVSFRMQLRISLQLHLQTEIFLGNLFFFIGIPIPLCKERDWKYLNGTNSKGNKKKMKRKDEKICSAQAQTIKIHQLLAWNLLFIFMNGEKDGKEKKMADIWNSDLTEVGSIFWGYLLLEDFHTSLLFLCFTPLSVTVRWNFHLIPKEKAIASIRQRIIFFPFIFLFGTETKNTHLRERKKITE